MVNKSGKWSAGLGRDRHNSYCWNAIAGGPVKFKRQWPRPRCLRTSAWLEIGITIKGLLFGNSFFEVKKTKEKKKSSLKRAAPSGIEILVSWAWRSSDMAAECHHHSRVPGLLPLSSTEGDAAPP